MNIRLRKKLDIVVKELSYQLGESQEFTKQLRKVARETRHKIITDKGEYLRGDYGRLIQQADGS